MRELLTGMVESNMSTMFTDVNEKTSEIAAQVGRTPQNWNSSVFSMIQNLSESVVVPIAGIIITLVLCYELISMLTERNNLHYQAQKAIRNVAPIQYKTEDDFALKGKICCGNCLRQLRHEKQYGEMVFCCGHKRSVGKFSHCYSGYYREQAVNSRVARAIKTVFTALEVVNQGMQEKKSITLQCVDVDDLKKQAEMIRAEQIKLYESYADGILTRNEYLEKKKGLGEKLADLQEKIRIEEEEQETADELDEEIRSLTKQASQKTYIGGLTKECVDAFVSMVYLYDDQTMKVEFNCEDVIRRALEKYGA